MVAARTIFPKSRAKIETTKTVNQGTTTMVMIVTTIFATAENMLCEALPIFSVFVKIG